LNLNSAINGGNSKDTFTWENFFDRDIVSFETIGFDTNIFDNLLIGVAYSNGDITTDSIDIKKALC